jgi:hypothetical protein
MNSIDAFISSKLDKVLDKLNNLPELITQAIEQAFANDRRRLADLAQREADAATEALNRNVLEQVYSMGISLSHTKPGTRLSLTHLACALAYHRLTGSSALNSNGEPLELDYPEWAEKAIARAECIVNHITKGRLDEILQYQEYLESQQ